MEERFEYDDMNRLTDITLKRPSGQDLYCATTYDALGRMISKEAVTKVNNVPQVTTVFSLPVFDNTKVHAMSQAQTSEGVFPATSQIVTYTGFDKVGKVKQGNDSICYSYGYDRQRISMEEHVGNTLRTKRYVGYCEYVTENDGITTTAYTVTYLTGPYGVFGAVRSGNGSEDLYYILKDNLGSWTTITDKEGFVEQQLSYDAWGNLRNPQTWTNYTSNDTFDGPMFDRGYTGHEHLCNFGLVNMNGRMYDPVMSSFLSADRYVQDPSSAQGFNRYAYCMYNPLRYVDPSGWLSGGGGGSGYKPAVPYYANGIITINLPEVTIIADNPSLSNIYEYEEYEYTPNITSGGFDNGWGNSNGWSSGGHSGGSGGGNGNHGGGKPGNAPPEGTTIHSGNMLFPKTFLRYQIGALNQLGIISEDFWVDASTINIKETDLVYRSEYDDYVVNLYKDGDIMQGLALGNLVLKKVGEYEYTIQPDEYDFRIASYRSLGGNVATACGWAVHNYGTPPIFPKGTFMIRFYGTVTVKH